MKKVISYLIAICVAMQMVVPAFATSSQPLTDTEQNNLVEFFLESDLQQPEPISSISGIDGQLATFSYDQNNKRIEKDFNGDTTLFTYDSNGCMTKEESATRMVTYQYEDVDGQYICKGMSYQGEMYFFQYDDDGNVEYILDSNFNPVCRYDYVGLESICMSFTDGVWVKNEQDSFVGNINPFRYHAWYLDQEIGCYYIGAGIYYDIQNNVYIKNDFTLRSAAEGQVSNRSALYNEAVQNALGLLNSSHYGTAISQVTKSQWSSGKRWYDGLSVEEVTARCIYAENYGKNAYNDRVAIMRVIANRVNASYFGDSVRAVVTSRDQFSTINPRSWSSEGCSAARSAKDPNSEAWKQATILGCLLSLSVNITSLGTAVGGWPSGISSQLHFYSLDSAYLVSTFVVKNGALYQGSTKLKSVAVAGKGLLSITSSTTKESLLKPYFGDNKYNLFYSAAT